MNPQHPRRDENQIISAVVSAFELQWKELETRLHDGLKEDLAFHVREIIREQMRDEVRRLIAKAVKERVRVTVELV